MNEDIPEDFFGRRIEILEKEGLKERSRYQKRVYHTNPNSVGLDSHIALRGVQLTQKYLNISIFEMFK